MCQTWRCMWAFVSSIGLVHGGTLLQDRFVVCPSMLGSERLAFYGVFDGTVGDFASHYVMQHMLRNLLNERVSVVIDMVLVWLQAHVCVCVLSLSHIHDVIPPHYTNTALSCSCFLSFPRQWTGSLSFP